MAQDRVFNLITNYIYMYHVDSFLIIPVFPQQLQDNMSVDFSSETPLSRSAPIYSYSKSGPRSISITLELNRELITQINHNKSNIHLQDGDDYVDYFIKNIQAISLPTYAASSKMVNPPLVACRFGNDIFIKGVVSGSVGVDYALPITYDDKYAQVTVAFTVYEVDPYDALTAMKVGSYRGVDKTLSTSLERNVWGIGK